MDADRLEFPDGSVILVGASPEHPEREALELEFLLPPGCAAPPPHIHPRDHRELFQVLEGSFELLRGRSWEQLGAGESMEISPGTRHTFRNRGEDLARVRNVHDPAYGFEPYIRRLHALAVATGSVRPTSPRVAIGLAQLWSEHADTIRPADAPLRIGLAALAGLGRLLRMRPAEA